MLLDGGLEDIASNGTFLQTGGLHQVGDSADETNLGIEGSYSLGGTGTLSVTGLESIGAGVRHRDFYPERRHQYLGR